MLKKRLADLEQRFFVARAVAAELPAPSYTVEIPAFKDGIYLVDDFEGAAKDWAVEKDTYHLGTVVNPVPFKMATGGSLDSPGYSAQPWGAKTVPAQWTDIQSLNFSPSNATGDIDFDLTLDQVAFYQ